MFPNVMCFRYKPMQKVDGVTDGFTASGQQTGTSVEQTVIAQSQHHQQFLGMCKTLQVSKET